MTDTEIDFDALYAHHESGVGRFLAAMVRNRAVADELLQETFLEAWKGRAALAAAENPEAWLYGVARNRALNHLRGWRRGVAAMERLAAGPVSSAPPPDPLAVRDLLARHLKPDDRALVLLRYVHGYEGRELALMTGISEDAVRQRLSRARRKLRRAWSPPETAGSPVPATAEGSPS